MSSRSRRRKLRLGDATFDVVSGPLTKEAAWTMDTTQVSYSWASMLALADWCIKRDLIFAEQYTCAHCGTRQTIADVGRDRLYEQGRCEECHEVTDIKTRGGAIVAFDIPEAERERFRKVAEDIRTTPDHYWANQGRDA